MKFVTLLVLLSAFCLIPVRAEEPKPEAKPEKGKDDKAREERRRDGANRGGQGGDRNWGGGPGAAGGREAIGAMLGLGGIGGNNAMSRGMMGLVRGMLGIDIEDPKATAKIDGLQFGVERRAVLNVPVGGVDAPGASGDGWKMETFFKLTDVQQKSLETLRDEYKTENKKFEQELLEQQKALAEKVKQLRLKYELRANDVLTGDDKTSKEKMDALVRETNEKNAKIVADTLPLYPDANDRTQQFAMVRSIREKTQPVIKESEKKLVELTPAESRSKMEEVLKQQATIRETMTGWMEMGGGRRGPGGPGGRGGDAVTPPRPPENVAPGNF